MPTRPSCSSMHTPMHPYLPGNFTRVRLPGDNIQRCFARAPFPCALAGRRRTCSLLGLPGVLLPRLGAPASSFSLARFPARASLDADAAFLTSSRYSIAAARHAVCAALSSFAILIFANFSRRFSSTTLSAPACRARLVFGSSPRILRKRKLQCIGR
ncbi:uncharacterized protein [Zea mays]|uniref:Uncharacterized protein n=1 Tax=Zea mays TaxID=4577 RepID=B4FJI6_MAIZE|nr:uncharacterized protein LOC118476324 [Zea mays]XP_035821192.1 uncharacterized protein LOC118476324 [Zea mays]XP_035821193.1 uncharacterized protein LOC118476324 [Zea mays]XP_035821194.1 uncharacterized protein LOC118476324 [Zea mays]XP_035821195.1 uncharacterized protein LOC118476324 [Zea mays]XP_035821196.1 uncharacterized protein LOC118476324 [Zea mays]ACF82279.1 unknown [Zea mays]ACG27607.1 hypothetical protein [Zea mays]|eukprot:NP_001136618.1 uncharacterized protein LOC100216742 [Zea mays]